MYTWLILTDILIVTNYYLKNIFQHHDDPAIGVHVIDRYTYYVLQFLEEIQPNSKATLGELVSDQESLRFFWYSLPVFRLPLLPKGKLLNLIILLYNYNNDFMQYF